MKVLKIILLLLINLSSFINAMDPPRLQQISITCSDNEQVWMHRKALDQSTTLQSLLGDCSLLDESSINISLKGVSRATFQVMTVITACMNKLAQGNSEFCRKKSSELIRENIYELMEIIEKVIDIASINHTEQQDITLNLFSVANHLHLPLVYQAIACIIVRYNIFSLTQLPQFLPQWKWLKDIACPERDPRICKDMWQKIQEAQHFLSTDFDIKPDGTEVTLTTYSDLCEWGLAPDSPVPENIKTCNDYIRLLIQEHKFCELKTMFDALADQHHETFTNNVRQISYSFITQLVTDYINDKKFDLLQDMLDLLVTNHLIDLAKQAYEKLVSCVKKMPQEKATSIFNHTSLGQSALKMALSFKLEQVEYFTKCTQDGNRIDTTGDICLVEFLEKFPSPLYEYFNVCNNNTHCPIFDQENLKYLIPILEPLFERTVHKFALCAQKLSYLPAEICLLSELRSLIVTNNQLIDLPEEICLLKYLSWFSCDQNQFTFVPPVVFNLKNLVTLNIACNQITSLPDELVCMKTLKKLYLDRTLAKPDLFQKSNLKIKLWDGELGQWLA